MEAGIFLGRCVEEKDLNLQCFSLKGGQETAVHDVIVCEQGICL